MSDDHNHSRGHISVSAATFARLAAHCKREGISMGQFLDLRLIEYLDQQDEAARYRALCQGLEHRSGAVVKR